MSLWPSDIFCGCLYPAGGVFIGQVIRYTAVIRNELQIIGGMNMAKTYFTLTGTKHYYGADFLKKGMRLTLEKEPDNKYDREAIMVKLDCLGTIGYVANSVYTVLGESMSAGRLYDKIGDQADAKVVLVTSCGILCKVCKKSLAENISDTKNSCI